MLALARLWRAASADTCVVEIHSPMEIAGQMESYGSVVEDLGGVLRASRKAGEKILCFLRTPGSDEHLHQVALHRLAHDLVVGTLCGDDGQLAFLHGVLGKSRTVEPPTFPVMAVRLAPQGFAVRIRETTARGKLEP